MQKRDGKSCNKEVGGAINGLVREEGLSMNNVRRLYEKMLVGTLWQWGTDVV